MIALFSALGQQSKKMDKNVSTLYLLSEI